MEPRIQYAKTKDGVSIALWTLGEGPPLVHLTFGVGHTQLEWEIAECRQWYEALARSRRLVRFDIRAQGLSDREVGTPSLQDYVLDLEAVADRLGLERFALCGLLHTGPPAIAYAARHPERVSHLVLWATNARASEWAQSSKVQAVRALMDKDWVVYTEAMANVLLGWSEGEPARRFAALVRESMTREDLQAAIAGIGEWDVTDLLPHVRSPTLVVQRRRADPGVAVARSLASRIPDARLVILDGESAAPYLGDAEGALRAIEEFLGEGEEAAATAAATEQGAFRTILFTDVEGSTALTQRLGDAKARELLREHERIVREALAAHGGSEIKTMGDGFMASFGSATKALECAVAVQRAFEARNASLPARPEPVEGRAEPPPSAHASRASARADRSVDAEPIRVRIGLNAGEPIAEEDDLFGTAVIMAERICGKAQGGEIISSNVVRELAAGKGFLFSDRGETVLRGFDDPVRLYEVRWQEEERPATAPAEP